MAWDLFEVPNDSLVRVSAVNIPNHAAAEGTVSTLIDDADYSGRNACSGRGVMAGWMQWQP